MAAKESRLTNAKNWFANKMQETGEKVNVEEAAKVLFDKITGSVLAAGDMESGAFASDLERAVWVRCVEYANQVRKEPDKIDDNDVNNVLCDIAGVPRPSADGRGKASGEGPKSARERRVDAHRDAAGRTAP